MDEERLLRVEVYRDSAPWRERLISLGLRTGLPPDPSRYDARSRTVLVFVGETGYETRAWLLSATMRQFHHHAKRKNAALVDHWFVVGLSEMAAMHRWEDGDLEIGARLLISKVDTPALALEAMLHRPANLPQFTPKVLESRPMAWTLTCFLMEGEKGKHRKRFQKLALGHRGSMIDGERLAHSLGPADEILPAVQTWLRSRQQPLKVLAGDFEDRGDGHIVGTGAKNCAIAAPPDAVKRLSCVLEVEPGQAAGLLVDYRNEATFTYLLFKHGHLYVGHVRPSSPRARALPPAAARDLGATRARGLRNRRADQPTSRWRGRRPPGRPAAAPGAGRGGGQHGLLGARVGVIRPAALATFRTSARGRPSRSSGRVSICAWARRRFSALMVPRTWLPVARRRPSSMRLEIPFRRWCCSIMSCVSNIERVNMNSHEKEALLLLSGSMSTGADVSTMEQMCPWGAMTVVIVFQWPSVSLRQRT